MFASTRHPTWAELAPQIKAYYDAYKAAGHPGKGQVYVSAPIYIAETEERARAEAEESVTHFYRLQYELIAESARRSGRQNFIDRAEKLRTLTYADALRGNVLVGTPDSVAAQAEAAARRDRLRRHPRRAELRRADPARPGAERDPPLVPGGHAAPERLIYAPVRGCFTLR